MAKLSGHRQMGRSQDVDYRTLTRLAVPFVQRGVMIFNNEMNRQAAKWIQYRA